jgi:D-alanine-D-alanine ligase
MDKKTAKALLRAAGLPVARGLTVDADTGWLDVGGITAILGLPLFVKPARLGSSVGITKVKHAGDLQQAVKTALRFDTKVLIEECVDGRELECAVLGNRDPKASVPGEIVPTDEWYSYDAKYVLDDGARLVAPAQLDPEHVAAIQDMAVRAYQALGCSGMARVDFFMRSDGGLVINELNTIPGFTNISMYPKLWDITGIGYAQLVDRLIELALERHARLADLAVDYQTAP